MQLPLAEGATLGERYRVGRELGRGGMGAVFAARHLVLDEPVAIKVLLPGGTRGPQSSARFVREARTAMRLRSEHAVRVLDVGVEGELVYMVMEHLEGRDLQGVLRERGPLPIDEVAGYVLQACEALAEAHAAGIVHRDLKPANLFLTRRFDGSPLLKVLDFGVAKLLEAQPVEASLTASAVSVGSPLYMAPEQIRSAKTVDTRADIWSLGVVLYELSTGELPYTADDVQGLLAAIVSEEPRPLDAVKRGIPPAFEAVVTRCLRRLRDQRFASVAELAQALKPFAPPWARSSLERIKNAPRAQQPSLPQADVPLDPLAATEDASRPGGETVANVTLASSEETASTQPPSQRRRRWLLPSVALGLLLLGGLQVAWMNHSTPAPVQAAPVQPKADPSPPAAPDSAPPVPQVTLMPPPSASSPAPQASAVASSAAPAVASPASASARAAAPAGKPPADKAAGAARPRASSPSASRIDQAINSRE